MGSDENKQECDHLKTWRMFHHRIVRCGTCVGARLSYITIKCAICIVIASWQKNPLPSHQSAILWVGIVAFPSMTMTIEFQFAVYIRSSPVVGFSPIGRELYVVLFHNPLTSWCLISNTFSSRFTNKNTLHNKFHVLNLFPLFWHFDQIYEISEKA